MSPSQAGTIRPQHLLLANAVRILGGAERFIVDAALGLAERGYDITVQAYPQSPLAQLVEDSGLRLHAIPTRADAAPWTVAQLMPWLVSQNVDVVLTNYDKDLRTVGWAARMSPRSITVIHSRECDVPLKNLPHYRFFYNRVAHHILTNSESTRQRTIDSAHWLDPGRVSVLYKGVDIGRFAIAEGRDLREHWDLTPDEVALGFVGQLVPRKRVAELLKTLSHEAVRQRKWKLLIAGTGPEEASLRELVSVMGLNDRVRFLGFVEDIAPFMRAIDVLVLPSHVEGFGYVIAEAAAAGTPSVAYRSSSVPEIVSHGETGLLADPELPGSLTHALLPFIDDSQLRERMGMAAMDRARKYFGVETMLENLERTILKHFRQMHSSGEPPLSPDAYEAEGLEKHRLPEGDGSN